MKAMKKVKKVMMKGCLKEKKKLVRMKLMGRYLSILTNIVWIFSNI